jgi:hypothetical protein
MHAADTTSGLSSRLDGMTEGVNTFFLTWAGSLVFVMHAGFAMVRPAVAGVQLDGEREGGWCQQQSSCGRADGSCRLTPRPTKALFPNLTAPPAPQTTVQLCAGALRSKNTMNILLQTILDAAVSALAFYLVG